MEVFHYNYFVECSRISPQDATLKEMCKPLRRQLSNYGDQWWIEDCLEIKKAAAAVNSHNLHGTVKHTGPRKPSLKEAIKESDDSLAYSAGLVGSVVRMIWTAASLTHDNNRPLTNTCSRNNANRCLSSIRNGSHRRARRPLKE